MKINRNHIDSNPNTAVKQSEVNQMQIKALKREKANGNVYEVEQKSKSEHVMDEKQLIEAIEKTNKAIESTTCSFEYSIHEQTKQIMVRVIDNKTKEVIKEFPPEKILDMVAKMWEVAGIIVDERR